MIFSENRYPLFRIMLQSDGQFVAKWVHSASPKRTDFPDLAPRVRIALRQPALAFAEIA
jgi:hypothetical protein